MSSSICFIKRGIRESFISKLSTEAMFCPFEGASSAWDNFMPAVSFGVVTSFRSFNTTLNPLKVSIWFMISELCDFI